MSNGFLSLALRLGLAQIAAGIAGVVTFFKITEDGDFKITEDGDFKITEDG